jgi:hypothetical protein
VIEGAAHAMNFSHPGELAHVIELALKLADVVEQIAQADGLVPSDVLHTMFIESPNRPS